MIITSRQNPKIKWLVSLRKRRERDVAKLTLIDGFEELSTALAAGAKFQQLYYCPELMHDISETSLLQRAELQSVEVIELSKTVFEKAAYRESADGWLGVCSSVSVTLGQIKFKNKPPFVLVCESVEKPGNLGAMLRTADAAGVDAVIAVDAVTDWSNPNVVRASKGAIFSVPVAEATQAELMNWLKLNDLKIVAATPSASKKYTDVDLTIGVALFVGAEKPGLSDFWLENSDIKVLIPMVGKVDSLNVATSGALLMYEVVRQRQTA